MTGDTFAIKTEARNRMTSGRIQTNGTTWLEKLNLRNQKESGFEATNQYAELSPKRSVKRNLILKGETYRWTR
ncbi:MAG: hypothetical protein CMI29_06565 [Opitutae bacterium]|nr:hypothetical protein [Opitutae bacterium]